MLHTDGGGEYTNVDVFCKRMSVARQVSEARNAKHGGNLNTYVRALKEARLDIYLQVPRGMIVAESTLRKIGAAHPCDVVLDLRWSLYGMKKAGRLWIQLIYV